MATYYWVGGSGNWDATSTANWSNASGGSSGFGPPTANDDVIFDAGSNVGTNPFTVTVTGTSSAPAVCRDFSTGGAGGALDGAMTLTMGAAARIDCYGSMTLPAASLTMSTTAGALIGFRSTGSQTLTTNGVSLANAGIVVDGIGGTLTLGSALTCNSITVTNGTFNTSASNYAVTSGSISSNNSNVRTISLNGSAVALSASAPLVFTTTTNLTFNAGTSTITCSPSSPTFNGAGLTYYNVTFSSTSSGTTVISGANTFNNLTITSRSAAGVRIVAFSDNQTVNGVLTFGAANTAVRRVLVLSNTIGTRRTIALNGTLATLADVDFRDIGAAGTVATPWTGTRLGNGLNNNNITFATPKTVYWNLAGSQNWSATGWATTNNGVPALNNFPLAQDTAVFTEAGAAGTVTMDAPWWIGSINMADGVSNRTTAFTIATSTQTLVVYGNITFFSSLTLTGTGTVFFAGQGTTQSITSAGVSFTQPITVNSPGGTVQLSGNLTTTSATAFIFSAGTLDLNNNALTCVLFSSSTSATRAVAFGAGNITVTGNNATVWNTGNSANLTITGTPVVNFTYAGATGTRAINFGPAGEANAISVNVTAGTDIVSLATTSGAYKNINFTGFAGSATFANSIWCFGNFTASTGMTFNAGTTTLSFRATSGTQTVTSNGKTMDSRVIVNAPGATVRFADAFTQGSTREFVFSDGTIEFPAGAASTVGSFTTSGTTLKTLKSTTNGVQATLSQASGTVSASYTAIKDINATGGALFYAYEYNGNSDDGNNTGWVFYIWNVQPNDSSSWAAQANDLSSWTVQPNQPSDP